MKIIGHQFKKNRLRIYLIEILMFTFMSVQRLHLHAIYT